MAKLVRWQREYIVYLKFASNKELFEEMVATQRPNCYDEYFSSGGLWRAQESLGQVRERLKDWLNREVDSVSKITL